jgi:peptidyl-prolyl cis-trans isomerase B (cyclophilin B)
MSSSRRPSRRVPSKGRSLRNDPRPGQGADDVAATVDSGTTAVGGAGGPRPGSRAANRAAKRAVSGVRPKTRLQGGSGGRRSSGSNNALIALAIGAVVIVAAVILIGNPFGNPAASPTAGASPTPATPVVVGDGTCPTSQPAPLPAGESRTVTISTPKGDIVLRIDGSLSPIAAGNFVALAACHFYDGSVFHRTATLPSGTPFVIQGGEAKAGTGDIPYSIQDEAVTATYRRGTVAMARTDSPNSQTSQFFIVLDDEGAGPLTSYNT